MGTSSGAQVRRICFLRPMKSRFLAKFILGGGLGMTELGLLELPLKRIWTLD